MSKLGSKMVTKFDDYPLIENSLLKKSVSKEFRTVNNVLFNESPKKPSITSFLFSTEYLTITEEMNKNVDEIVERLKSFVFFECPEDNLPITENSEKENFTDKNFNYSCIINENKEFDNNLTNEDSVLKKKKFISNNQDRNDILIDNIDSAKYEISCPTYELNKSDSTSNNEYHKSSLDYFQDYISKCDNIEFKKTEPSSCSNSNTCQLTNKNKGLMNNIDSSRKQRIFFQNKNGYGKPASDYIPIIRDCEQLFEEDKKDTDDYTNVNELDDDVTVDYSFGDIERYYSWEECNLNDKLLKNILKSSYAKPRKIQSVVIPFIMKEIDVKVQSENGTGKTVAYLVPIINSMLKNGFPKQKASPHALIIVPVRELAIQIFEQARKLCSGLEIFCGRLYGQTNMKYSERFLSEGCDILVCTPGRLRDFVQRGILILKNVKYLIYDEADRLFEYNFNEDIEKIILNMNQNQIDKRITLLFSTTFDVPLENFVKKVLKKTFANIINSRFNEVNKKVNHNIINVTGLNKNKMVCEILANEQKIAFENGCKIRKTLIFVEKKTSAHVLAMYLVHQGINALSINGDYSQETRENALLDFRNDKVDVIVATDVFARGLDIHLLDHVINLNLPHDFFTFINRVGRTGRIRDSEATSFYDSNTDEHFKNNLVKILKESSISVPDFLL